MLHNVTLKILP